jgi:hypothetical protein
MKSKNRETKKGIGKTEKMRKTVDDENYRNT